MSQADGVKIERIKTPGLTSVNHALKGAKAMFAYRVAVRIRKNAKALAPVRTGYLKRSIKADKIAPGHWTVTVGAHYGRYVEYGTRYMHAQPYMTPAIEACKAELPAMWDVEFKKAMAKSGASGRTLVR